VTALARGDAERLVGFVAGIEDVSEDQPFTAEFLAELGQLVEADAISYCELDRVRRRTLLLLDRPDDDQGEDPGEDLFWDVIVNEHPVCHEHQRGRFLALKVSDFLTRRQLRGTRLYRDWFAHYGVEFELSIPIPSPLWHTKTFIFDRAGTRDFTERDRLVLDLLQPHLGRRWREARLRRLLRAALDELDRGSEDESRGVIFLDGVGDVEFASPPARRLVRDFLGVELGLRLPPELETPLVMHRGARRLDVERSGDTLLLRETRPEVELTAREQEVLAWVARGKTNAEIAQLLWLSPGTVRKHLENVYAKLGVSTRTAAVARFLGLIGAEAS
jgi:DNA-binding CsgD family transcriptional regulator